MYIWVCVFSAVPLFMRFYYIVFFISIQINKNWNNVSYHPLFTIKIIHDAIECQD